MPELSALILTYNEGPSIGPVVEKVLGVLRRLDAEAEVVVVDGGSQDGTQDNARAAGAIVHQQIERGYGAAFREGLGHIRSTYLVTLDADMSHDPELAVQLWEERKKADIVIASRYCPGGSATLSPFRRFLSWFMNGTYRLVLELPIADMSSGYRIYRHAAVWPMDLVSHDFDVLEEVLVKSYNQGYSVREIPFHFQPRIHGESHLQVVKFGLSYYRTLVRLSRLRHSQEAADLDVRSLRSIVPRRRMMARNRQLVLRQMQEVGGTVLDVGGTAAALGVYPRDGEGPTLEGQVVVVDGRPDRLRVLRKRDFPCLLVDPSRLPFPSASFGSVACSSSAFANPTALTELWRVLRPGGEMFLYLERMQATLTQVGQAGIPVPKMPLPAIITGPVISCRLKKPAVLDMEPVAPQAQCPSCGKLLAWNGRGPLVCDNGHRIPTETWGYDVTRMSS